MKKSFKLMFLFCTAIILPGLCQADNIVLTETSPNFTITGDSDDRIYGTCSPNEIILESGANAELINFQGNNTITIQSSSSVFTVFRSGTVVTFQGSDGTILRMPATTSVQTISFNDQTLTLNIYNGKVMLDDQVIGLDNESISSTVISSEGWSSGAPMPTGRHWAASAVVGNDIYVIGGASYGSGKRNEKYNTLTDSWSSLSSMPFSNFLLRGATVGGKIYIFGGYMYSSAYSSNLVYRFDPSSGNWTKLNDMPYLRWMGTPTVVNDKIYIFGGKDEFDEVSSTVLEYDPATDTWETKTSMPTARYAPATAVYNNKIYVMGGNYGTKKNELYDPATDTWETKADLPCYNYGWGVAGEISGEIYFVNSDTNEMAVYSPTYDSWALTDGLKTPRDYLTGETVNGKLYIFGGLFRDDDHTTVNLVDIYTPSDSRSASPQFRSGAYKVIEELDKSDDYQRQHLDDEKALIELNRNPL